MSTTQQHLLNAYDDTPLFVTDWLPATPVRASILLMHGLGEHSGRYAHVIRFFNQRGLLVRSYDHRGHGHSGGPRGDIPETTSLLEDAKLVLDDLCQRQKHAYPENGAPFLFGHSMGGLLAAQFATAAILPLRGLILSSPALALRLNRMQRVLLAVLTQISPTLCLSNRLNTQYLSHDPLVIQSYHTDPMVHDKISARLLNSMLDAAKFVIHRAPTLTTPTLLLIANDDHIIDPKGSQQFFTALHPTMRTQYRYPGMYHELFNEVDAKRVFDDLNTWLDQQLSTSLMHNPEMH